LGRFLGILSRKHQAQQKVSIELLLAMYVVATCDTNLLCSIFFADMIKNIRIKWKVPPASTPAINQPKTPPSLQAPKTAISQHQQQHQQEELLD
jgi:hypothetical protein